MNPRLRFVARAAVCVAAVSALPAQAHDTWFAPLPADARGGITLALGTGNQFPVHESGIGLQYLQHSGCRGELGRAPLTLQRTADAPTALKLRVRAEVGQALTCWAQTSSFDVDLGDDKVALYLREIQAPAEVRETWAQMRARGIRWKERYTKHARIELNPADSAATPVGMALDALLEAPRRTPRPGDTLQFRVLRNGQPLPDFAVELRGDSLPIGVWRKTDPEGRVRFSAPLPGRWLLRGTDLRLSQREPDTWESRFVTLAFEIQADSNDRPNARSTNHTAATAAITSEPPAITVRR